MFLFIRLLGILACLSFSVSALSDTQSVGLTKAAVTQNTVRQAPSTKQQGFLACTATCGFKSESQNPLSCLSSCKDQSGLNDQEFASYIRSGIHGGASAAGSVGGGWGFGFTCDPFETTCSCKGFFDCKILEKSQCCSGKVDTCQDTKGGAETCFCDKSPQCSL